MFRLIPVKVREVVLDSVQNPLLLLVDLDETIVLPIGIGFWEAQAIVLKLHGHLPPRPMTHDLIKFSAANWGPEWRRLWSMTLKKTLSLRKFTGYHLRELVVDARPSDAVA